MTDRRITRILILLLILAVITIPVSADTHIEMTGHATMVHQTTGLPEDEPEEVVQNITPALTIITFGEEK